MRTETFKRLMWITLSFLPGFSGFALAQSLQCVVSTKDQTVPLPVWIDNGDPRRQIGLLGFFIVEQSDGQMQMEIVPPEEANRRMQALVESDKSRRTAYDKLIANTVPAGPIRDYLLKNQIRDFLHEERAAADAHRLASRYLFAQVLVRSYGDGTMTDQSRLTLTVNNGNYSQPIDRSDSSLGLIKGLNSQVPYMALNQRIHKTSLSISCSR